jgi:endonuclease/exonuclease/phosphatase (EEP) superfamily protein YafD
VLLIRLGGLVLAAVAGLQLAAVESWPFELVHHFALPCALAALALCALAVALGQRLLATAAALLSLVFMIVISQELGEPQAARANRLGPAEVLALADPSRGRQISLISQNVYCRNADPDGLRRWLRTRPADVVSLVEVPLYLEHRLDGLSDVYPYHARISSEPTRAGRQVQGCQGMLILSTLPITASQVYRPLQKAWPALFVHIAVPGRPVPAGFWLAAIHAADPVRQPQHALRDRLLALLPAELAKLSGPLVVAGDFNATPYTPAFRRFAVTAGLAAPWSPGSYPARLGTFGLPIDHVLVREANLLRLEPLPSYGSDHRPLRAVIGLAPQGPALAARVPGPAGNSAVGLR